MARINFVGDVAIFKEFENRKCDPFLSIRFPESDFNVANLEFPLPADCAAKAFYDVDNSYRVSDQFSRELMLGRFDLYSLANNHVWDYGLDGLNQTVDKIVTSGAGYFGVGSKPFNTASYDIEGVSFLFLAFVKKGRWDREPGGFGPDAYEMDDLLALISSSKASYDHIIIFPHWGTELVNAPDPDDVNNARLMIDAGASCVVGHHPHVSQGCEVYKNGLIAYSLGSFIYLPDFEKGNRDKSFERDVSICLNVEFSKSSILSHTPHKYVLNREKMIPTFAGDLREDEKYNFMCSVIGDRKYYSGKIRSNLLRRELSSFVSRFKENPLRAVMHYFRYIEVRHIKKIMGIR